MSIRWLRALALAGVCAVGAPAQADGLIDPATYVYLDTVTRQITIEGMERRLEAYRTASASPADIVAVSRRTEREIGQIFADWGLTPAEHAAFGARHRRAVEAWLERHPDWRRGYRELERRFETLSSQLDQVR